MSIPSSIEHDRNCSNGGYQIAPAPTHRPSYTKGTRPYADLRGTHTDHPDDHMRAFSTSLPGPLSGRGSEYCWYLLFCLRTIASPAESFVPTKKHTKNDHETGAPQRYASPSRREREKLRRCGSRRPNPSVMKGASVSVALVTSAPPGKETDGDTSACQVFALLRKPNIEPLPTIIYNR
ncbi:hypothetical protein GEV33_007377 [Tenebrio molitor]|uniref:Uncharacterized protein n=1 Tax=Tenebrio molitor TaxID=7067 RepID=A0A8J6HIN9_TENMO|nr:hypothetical protein GEV33_007377 [Tenebrio molitor]